MGLALAKVKSDPDGVGHHEEDAGDEEHGEQRAFPASLERARPRPERFGTMSLD